MLGLILIVILFSYGYGRRVGQQHGILVGTTQTRLQIKAHSLAENNCEICHRPLREDFHHQVPNE